LVVNVLRVDELAPVWIDSIDVTVGGELIVLTFKAPVPAQDKFEQAAVFRCAMTRPSLVRAMETCGKALHATQAVTASQQKN
jgi:hypothetical protein